MCSPFVLSQSYKKIKDFDLNQNYQISKIKSSMLLPYHFGRITTYSFIALIFSKFAQIIESHYFKQISSLLMFFAAIMIIKANFPQYFSKFKITKINFLNKIFSLTTKKTKDLNGFLLGISLGFLPCGLVYAALMIAMSLANPIISFFFMFCFGLSTIPALFCVSYGNSILIKKSKKYLDFLILLTLSINIMSLIFYIFNPT
jgi:sulfite exporter TauE/SafE